MPIPLIIPLAAAGTGAAVAYGAYKASNRRKSASGSVRIPVFGKDGGGYATLSNDRLTLPSGRQTYITASNPADISTKYLLMGAAGVALLGLMMKFAG